jgi:serine/threonine protein kinase
LLAFFSFQKNFIKFKLKTEIEKKLLGEKNLNFKLNDYLNLKEDDFKIKLSEIANVEQIGEGASSVVFKGKYNKGTIALKLFKLFFESDNDSDKISLINFKKELELISKLKSQFIINFIGFVAEKNRFGIVLEFCENGTLKSFLKKNKNLDFKFKINILIDISRGKKKFFFKFNFFNNIYLI